MNIIDRYIARQFLMTLLFALVALCVIFLIINLLESLDDFLDAGASFAVIAKYYIHFFPEILKILTPVATLIATLFTIGRMSVLNEITAIKSGGMSLYRLMIPLGALALLISFAQLYFNGWVVPVANQRKIAIEQKYLNKGSSGGPIYNLQFRDNPLKNVIMQYYNAETKTGSKVSVEEFTTEMKPRLTSRIESDRIEWDTVSHRWKLSKGWIRKYIEGGNILRHFDTMYIELSISHSQIAQLRRSVDEMNYDELRGYIELMKMGGKDIRRQMIDYYGKYAFPFANFIVILFGVPFAFEKRRGGIAIQIGAAMVISFLYLVFTKIGQTIGFSMNLAPVAVGWSANIIFLVFGLINIFRTKT
ncbi:MAG: hypothetical protein QG635_846 [Bacteroidota bacterium]|nr:hypothetical protein [Bacteroidota bacterium]